MAKNDPTTVTIKFAEEPARETLWADRFKIESVAGFHRIYFGTELRTEVGVSISKDALDGQRADLTRYTEKFGERLPVRPSQVDLSSKVRVFPSDAMHVSNRGGEGEFKFYFFSLHDLVTVKQRTEKSVHAHPMVFVRCPFEMVQEIMFALLDREKSPE